MLTYFYSLDPHGSLYDEDPATVFDIRDFPSPDPRLNPDEPQDHAELLRRLIDTPEWLAQWLPTE